MTLAKHDAIRAYYHTLFSAWGRQHWWPAQTPFEVILGAYLTQNTAWTNVERALDLSLTIIRYSVAAQLLGGAKAIFMAEPAANLVYVSPKQIAAGSDLFERYAIAADRQIQSLVAERGAELIFHCCGELDDYMVRQFCTLEPVILSLGSSRKLWEDAAIVP